MRLQRSLVFRLIAPHLSPVRTMTCKKCCRWRYQNSRKWGASFQKGLYPTIPQPPKPSMKRLPNTIFPHCQTRSHWRNRLPATDDWPPRTKLERSATEYEHRPVLARPQSARRRDCGRWRYAGRFGPAGRDRCVRPRNDQGAQVRNPATAHRRYSRPGRAGEKAASAKCEPKNCAGYGAGPVAPQRRGEKEDRERNLSAMLAPRPLGASDAQAFGGGARNRSVRPMRGRLRGELWRMGGVAMNTKTRRCGKCRNRLIRLR